MGSNVRTSENGIWALRFLNPETPEGATLKVRAKLSTKNLQGNEPILVFRADKGDRTVIFETTQGRQILTGNFNGREIEFTIGDFYNKSDAMSVLLIFQSDSQGEVILEDLDITIGT